MKAILRKVGKARFFLPAAIAVVALVLISNLAYAYTTSNVRILSIEEDRFYNYDFIDEVAVIEDFEWGSDGTSLAESGGDVDWKVSASGDSYAEIDDDIDDMSYLGTRSAKIYRDGSNSVYAYYSRFHPDFIGSYLRKDGTAYTYIINGDGTHRILVRITSAEKVQYYDDAGYHDTGSGYTIPIDTWYLIELKNIDWGTATYDIYVNGNILKSGAAMHTYSGNKGYIYYGSSAGSGSFWVDEIVYEEAIIEDFEWGSGGTSLSTSGGDVYWTVTKLGYGTASAKIDTSPHHQGTRSAEFYSNYNGWDITAWVLASYPEYRPQWRGFWARTSGVSGITTTGWVTATGDEQHFLSVRVQLGGRLQYRQDSYSWHDTNPVFKINPNSWYFIEFRNIDWDAATYSIYVNSNRVQDGVPMVSGTDWHGLDYDGITAYATDDTYDACGGSFWIDDIPLEGLSTGVACPVTMMFYNNAEVDKVKWIYFGPAPPYLAVTDHALLNDGNGWIWDGDRGTKETWWSSELGELVWMHMRVYAPNPPDYMSNSVWGNYVIGTTHFDQFPFELWYGYNEYAEEFFAWFASTFGFYTVYEDFIDFKNCEPYRAEPIIHPILGIPTYYYWLNDGYATVVNVP
jgi:hypothetical protein